MRVEILALSIPIIFIIGLFAVIALNILVKYKTKELTANRVESLDEWHKTETQVKIAKAEARAARNHGAVLRICGLVVGLGLGVAIGCIILACGGISRNSGFDSDAIATFLVISLAMIFSGAGMVGAWFLERRLDRK
jgi:hypothetical protein